MENNFIGSEIPTKKKIYNNHNNWIDLLTELKTKIHLLNDTVNLNLSLNLN